MGGIITTNSHDIADKVRMFRDHGRSERYTHKYIGYNMRFDPVKAVVCREKLKLLDGFNEERRECARYYNSILKNLNIVIPLEERWSYSVYHLYVVMFENETTRNNMMDNFKTSGVSVNIHYPIPSHKQPAIVNSLKHVPVTLVKTEMITKRILSLPIYPGLKKQEMDFVCGNIKSFLEEELNKNQQCIEMR